MIFGLANTSAYDNYIINKKELKIENNKIIILDLNFSKIFIHNIITKNYKQNLIMICGTSYFKIKKIKNLLDKINVLILNYKEFLNLTNKRIFNDAIKLIRKKYRNLTIVITNGPKKIHCIHKNKFYEANCPKTIVKNENAAGDAFSSIFFGEIYYNSTIQQALKKAIAAGCLSIKGINLNQINDYKKKLDLFSKKINVIKKNNYAK